jgi:hypothetical protein
MQVDQPVIEEPPEDWRSFAGAILVALGLLLLFYCLSG